MRNSRGKTGLWLQLPVGRSWYEEILKSRTILLAMLCSDIALIALAVPLTSILRGNFDLSWVQLYAQTRILCLASLLTWALVFFRMRLYSFPWGWTFAEAFSRCFVATAFVSAVAITLSFFWHALISRAFVIEYFAVIFTGSVTIRYLLGRGLRLSMFDKMKKVIRICCAWSAKPGEMLKSQANLIYLLKI